MSIFKSPLGLYANPELYDATDQGSTGELNFYLHEAERLGNSVLELACGTGRLANELVESGIECDGLDLSEEMVRYAMQKAASRNLAVNYYVGDMTNFNLGKKYGLIFVPLNSLLHLHEIDEMMGFFSSVRNHLSATGELIFSVFNPSFKLLARKPNVRYFIKTFSDPVSGKKITLEETIDYDAATQVSRGTWYYSYPDQRDVFSHSMNVKSIFPQELESLVRLGNFKILKKYGSYQKENSTSASHHQIIVCAPV